MYECVMRSWTIDNQNKLVISICTLKAVLSFLSTFGFIFFFF